MKALLLVLSAVIALALTSTVPPNKQMVPGMGDVPECKKLLDKGDAAYHLPGCNEDVNTCFKEAHSIAPRCIAKGMKFFKENHPTKFDCFHKQEMENLKKNWFSASCKLHLAMVHCMAGDEATEDFEQTTTITDADLAAAKKAKKDWMDKGMEEYPDIGECWKQMVDKMHECDTKAKQECNNYGVCTASIDPTHDASERMKTWHEIAHVLEKIKYSKAKEFIVAGEECW